MFCHTRHAASSKTSHFFRDPGLSSVGHVPTSTSTVHPLADDIEGPDIWIYPTRPEKPVRKYQQDICESALFHNTLGKSFVSALLSILVD